MLTKDLRADDAEWRRVIVFSARMGRPSDMCTEDHAMVPW